MRRHLRTALAGGLLFGGISLVSVMAGSGTASAQPAVSLYVTTSGSGSVCSLVSPCGSIQEAITTARATIMAKQRLKVVQRDLFEQLDQLAF